MAINIKFDLIGNPEPPTILLANRNGNILGQLKVDSDSIELLDKFNDAYEISFTINKYIDNNITPLWDKVVDFKLVYCKEWNAWFEITVELDEATETVKTVMCTQLGQAELSQIKLYNIEINTEEDVERDDYKISILYDDEDPDASILNRLLKDKAPHYSIAYVSPTIAKIQRSFSFDGTSILDAFNEIAEEIGCIFQYYAGIEDGRLQRKIAVYDLQQTCNDCGHRGEFTDKCPKCGSTDITNGYGDDTLIFVTFDELASEGIQLVTDTDSVKNCFKLEAGDDLMTATVRACNPNGTEYIWYFSDSLKEDMPDELVDKLESYDELYRKQYNDSVSNIDTELLNNYNSLVDKYSTYNEDIQKIEAPITGYSNLMNAYYNTIDLALYLKSGLMPSVEMSETNAEEQAALLTTSSLSPVAVANTGNVSLTTANSAVLGMAKVVVRPTFKVEVKTSELHESEGVKYWRGKFTVTNYSDDEDVAESNEVYVELNDDLETVTKQKIEKILNKENTDDLSISGLFEKEYDDFCAELKKYALNPLTSFHNACQTCIDILIEQGVGNKDGWSDDTEGSEANLYEKLYLPYYNKLKAIEAEMAVRERELNIILGAYDNDGNLITKGLQTNIEECRNQIQDILNFKNYLGEELWLDFCAYRREDSYSNDNYISDGLNNAELFKNAQEFFEVAENEIYKSAELQHSISTTLNNLLAIPKFKPLVGSFKVGNWIRVQVDGRIFKLRLLEYTIDFGSFENIPVEFSDVTKVKNGVTDVESILSQASSMATSYDSVQRQANKGDRAKDTLEQWVSDGLNSATVQIHNNDNEEVAMTKNGLLCRSYDDITGTYSPEQLRLTHNIMAYTDDEWKTVRQAIGKHEYVLYNKDTNKFIDKIGYGMNADFVTAGVVSGSQIIGGDIYSDNYSIAEGTGSYLNLRDGTFSFGGGALRFEGGKLLISSPDIPTTDTITEINEEYLKTASVYAQNLQVKAVNIDGKLTASQINTDGLIAQDISATTITGKTITGGSISGTIINNGDGTFSVDADGNVTANALSADNATINGVITTDSLTATGGKIANFTIEDGFLYNGIKIGNENSCGISCGSSLGGDDEWIFWAGNGAFKVSLNGAASANNLSVTGGSFDIGSGTFKVDSDGNVTANALTANNAVINGVLSAGENSSIGDFKVDNNSIFSGEWNISSDKTPDVFMCTGSDNEYTIAGVKTSGWAFGAGESFGVTKDGDLYASSGEIGGLKIDSIQNRLYYENGVDDYTTMGLRSIEIVRSEQGWFRVGLLDGESDPLSVVMSSGLNALYMDSSTGGLLGTWTLNNGAIQTSDENLKNSIEPLSEKYSILFDNIVPVRFKYNDGTSNRYHTGFIAQELQRAIANAELSEQEVAALCTIKTKNKDDEYMGIRYDELIALCVNEIQKLKAQVEESKKI